MDDGYQAAYNALHDARTGHHYSNYMPGALTQLSRRDKAYGQPALTLPISDDIS
ncbi:hypothetical protein [Aliiroseovarius sp. 2305UL8-7]|uniref:hypothetical protein n=1 Tax=Aliiroseovarius conchicola TaxID=3121637 RepID=UPI0035284C6B